MCASTFSLFALFWKILRPLGEKNSIPKSHHPVFPDTSVFCVEITKGAESGDSYSKLVMGTPLGSGYEFPEGRTCFSDTPGTEPDIRIGKHEFSE